MTFLIFLALIIIIVQLYKLSQLILTIDQQHLDFSSASDWIDKYQGFVNDNAPESNVEKKQ